MTAATVNHWTATLPARRARPPLQGARQADLVVVGAGLVGLAAARRYAELAPERHVVLLDAGELAEGSAGRNSGYMIDAPLSHAMSTKATLGKISNTQFELAQLCYAWMHGLVERHRIECGWARAGRYYAAATPAGVAALDHLPQQLEAIGQTGTRVDAEALAAALGTRYYRRAVFNAGCTLVQPAALVRGLGDNLPGNVTLFENSRVRRWDRPRGGGHLLATAYGQVSTPRVVWATHTDLAQFTPLGQRYIPVWTYVGVTPRLDDARLGGGTLREWGVLPALRAGSTVRRLPDGRILLRSLWTYGRPLDADAIRAGLQPLLAKRFPAAADSGFEHVWGGPVAITRQARPWFGEFERGAWGYTGDNGSGLIKASVYGYLMAEMACGVDSPALRMAEAEAPAGWIPPEPLRRIAVAWNLARNARAGGAEI